MSTAEERARPDSAAAGRRAACAALTAAPGGSADATETAGPCPEPLNPDSPDLTWLLHRAAQHMRAAMDEAVRAHGLTAARDWIVLSALSTGARQTQLSLANALGLDKTTMTSLLDRMEARGLITRSLDRHDRRARIPELTEAGRQVEAAVTGARDRVEADLLRVFTEAEQRQLRDLLVRLTAAAANDHGSCM